jgi:hypothetical protein
VFEKNKQKYSGQELLRLSWEKTEKIKRRYAK